MKLNVKQELRDGKYTVYLSISEILPTEREKIQKFGSPQISLEPKRVLITRPEPKFVTTLPLHEINHPFIFNTEAEARSFLAVMKSRIAAGISSLKLRNDTFTKEETYEF